MIAWGTATGCGGDDDPASTAAGGDDGPCVPWGTWELTYQRGPQSCAPLTDVLTVAEGAGGKVLITFEGDSTPLDECVDPPVPGTYSATGAVSADGCTLEAHTSSSYCYSGEDQCEKRDLSLVLRGDSASGNLTYARCWCNDDPSGPPETVVASAKRKTP
jgi:hypothetical protein